MSSPLTDREWYLSEFRQALQDCRQLYLTSGRECVSQHPHLLPGSPQDFLSLMDDLHKGLLVKIYVTIAEADRRWSEGEKQLAKILFEHLWQNRLAEDQLRQAASHISEHAGSLQWYSLIRPFDQIAPLRNHIGELETVVMRVANLVAKADGEPCESEVACLRMIQDELHRHLYSLPLDEPGHHEAASSLGAQAVQQIKAESQQVRTQCELTSGPPVQEPERSPDQVLAEALEQLDALIGLDGVKHQIRTLTNFLKIQEERERAGLPATRLSLHMVFGGNPGTGKTTVARIVGQIFGAMGILSKGHLVETDRSGLVAAYAGQTGPKTNKKIDETLDGVLFIDEAYSLTADSQDDSFGREAVQTLLKRMEDDRDRLVVILAGYPEPMARLLKSNPGLSSRFNTKLIFEDYTASQLGLIFKSMCDKNHYQIPASTQTKLLLGFKWLYEHRDEHFGNGRLVRNTFENAIRHLANRIAEITPLTKELLTTLEPEDIAFPRVPAEIWTHLDDDQLRFTVACEGCSQESTIPARYLNRWVRCNKCQHRFLAAWGEPCENI